MPLLPTPPLNIIIIFIYWGCLAVQGWKEIATGQEMDKIRDTTQFTGRITRLSPQKTPLKTSTVSSSNNSAKNDFHGASVKISRAPMPSLPAADTGESRTMRAKGRQAQGIQAQGRGIFSVALSLVLFLSVVQFLPRSNLDQARCFLASPSNPRPNPNCREDLQRRSR